MSRKLNKNICTGKGYNILEGSQLAYLIDSDDTNNYMERSHNIIFPNLTKVKVNKKIVFLNNEHFSNFIDKISVENKKCIYNTSIYSEDYFIRFDYSTLQVTFTDKFLKNINKCLNRMNRIFIPLNLQFTDGGHSNIIIVDKKEEQMYFFEPHGSVFGNNISLYINIQEHCINIIKNLFKLHNYKSSNIFNKCGPQDMQRHSSNFIKSGGYCLSWSLLLIHLILLNSEKSIDDIVQFIKEIRPTKLNCYIQKYTTYIMNFAHKKYTNNIIDLKYNINIILTDQEINSIKNFICENINNQNALKMFVYLPKFGLYYIECKNKLQLQIQASRKRNFSDVIRNDVFFN